MTTTLAPPGPPRRPAPRPPSRRPRHAHPGIRGRQRRRLFAILVVVLIVAAAMIARLGQLQVHSPDRFVDFGETQRFRTDELPAVRGSLIDRNGVDLAMTVALPSVWADPRLVGDPVTEAARLAPMLERDTGDLVTLLSGSGRFTYLARHVSREVADQVVAAELDGVYVKDEPTRLNPADDLALPVLGRVVDGEQR